MLTQIQIHNFAIIEQLAIDFEQGLTVVTGETGAGKSIMIDALSLVLGDRADGSVIRADAKQADISAQFDIQQQAGVKAWLETQALEADDDCIIRRVISREGRSKSFINGRPVTLTMMRELGEQLVAIHGQHAHQALSKRSNQLDIVDNFGKLGTNVSKVADLWSAWHELNKQHNELKLSEQERLDKKELLTYQVQEMDELGLSAEELDGIEDLHKRLSHQSELLLATDRHAHELYRSDSGSIYSRLNRAIADLDPLSALDPKLKPAIELLHSSVIQVQEAYQELDNYQQQIQQNPAELQQLEQRLSDLHQLARKHKIEIQNLMPQYLSLSEELASLNKSSDQLEALEVELKVAHEKFTEAAEGLSSKRKKAAKQLVKAVNHYLEQLGMQGGSIEVQFEALSIEQANSRGIDRVELMISANPGQPLQPLSKVASGGELSRMSLAIQVVTHSDTSIPCLIFDEVDVGIGGGTAEIVGNLLAELSNRAQVLCVTHQAQVAAKGSSHFYVSKSSKKQSTTTAIQKLQGLERTEEIARMIGGIEITEKTRRYAEEMLN